MIIIKTLFYLILFLLFLHLFAFDSISEYLRRDLTVKISKRKSKEGNLFPDVTICVMNDPYISGWKNTSSNPLGRDGGYIAKLCNATQIEEILRCVEERTYIITEMIQVGPKNYYKELENKAEFRYDVIPPNCGKRLTISYPYLVSSNVINSIYFGLDPSNKYWIYLHDNEYRGRITSNPLDSKVKFILDGKYRMSAE